MNQVQKQQHAQGQTLADILKSEKEVSQATQSKISISNKIFSSIGRGIPPKYQCVTHLLISNNHLTSLSGIESFQNLTHLSVASNDIESIEELTKIYNKALISSLSVKKNFFLKNPQANIDLINIFPNIQYLDGFKISDATHKVIDESHNVSFQIMNFAIAIQHKITALNKLYSLIKLNDEYTRKKINGMNTIDDINNMNNNIQMLMKLNKVKLLKKDYINKYLNKNINPSVHVLKKIMNKSGLECDGESDIKIKHEEYAHCYEEIFSEILYLYESKNNYNELPFYLNYLILKDNPVLTKFFIQAIRQQSYDTNQGNATKSHIETISSICREFPSLFLYYTHYSNNILTKYQMMYFYQLNQKYDQLNGYHPVQEDMMIFFDEGIEKMCLDEFNKKVCVFLSNIECDSFPVFALNFDYMRVLTTVIQNRIYEYQNKTDKLLYFLQLLEDRKKMFLPNKPKRNENDLFKNNYSPSNMKNMKQGNQSHMSRGNKFNIPKNMNVFDQSKGNSNSKSRSNSKDNKQHNCHSSGHSFYKTNEIKDTNNHENNRDIKERSRSDEYNPNANLHVYRNEKDIDDIPFIVKPNQQFTLANDEDNSKEIKTISEDRKICQNQLQVSNNQLPSSCKHIPNSYSPTQKSGSDIIKQIKKDNRTNNLIKRYMKYHNGFVSLDIVTRLSPMKKFMMTLSLIVVKLKIPYLILAIETFISNKARKMLLYHLSSVNQRYFIIKHHLFHNLKRKVFKCLKQHKTISIHLKRGYYHSLLSKAFFSLLQRRARSLNKKQKYNRIQLYYYNKLLKKIWLTLKFYHQIQKKSEDEYPAGKFENLLNEQSGPEYERVFNFFHRENDNDSPLNNVVERSSKEEYNNRTNFSNFDHRDKILEADYEETEGQYNDNSNSMTHVNSLIDHLEGRIHSMNNILKTNSKNSKEKASYDKSSNSSKSQIKNKTKKGIRGKNKLCPYCASGIVHDKCVGENVSNIDNKKSNILNHSNAKILLLGAPNYIRNTPNFIHKKLN